MSNSRNPASILFDSYGGEISTLEGYGLISTPTSTKPGIPVMGKDDVGEAQFLALDADGYLQTSAPNTDGVAKQRSEAVGVDYFKTGIASSGPQYFLAIDLDNAGGAGSYLHETGANGIWLTGITGTLIKSKTGAAWDAIFGVIMAIDGTEATIAYLEFGSLHARATDKIAETFIKLFTGNVDLTVVGGQLRRFATGLEETTTDINTGMTLSDVKGVARTPAVGDILFKVENLSTAAPPSGTSEIHYSFAYFVE